MADGQPGVMQERWIFNAPQLKQLLKRDAIGLGYTVFLPWSRYRPDISKVRLKVQFAPAQGTPLYAQDAPLTVNHGGTAPAPGPVVSHSGKPRS